MSPKLVAFAGSYRAGSYNKKLLAIAVEAARKAGAQVDVIDLKELNLPMYDGDLEDSQGIPEGALRFKAQLAAAHGMLIASPEYNSSIPAALKNAIDWATRPSDLSGFAGKLAVLMAASPGGFGGLRGLVSVRSILGNIGVLVLPEQVAIPKVHEAMDSDGQLKDAKQQAQVQALGQRIAALAAKLA